MEIIYLKQYLIQLLECVVYSINLYLLYKSNRPILNFAYREHFRCTQMIVKNLQVIRSHF
jgi:hypothetical protein